MNDPAKVIPISEVTAIESKAMHLPEKARLIVVDSNDGMTIADNTVKDLVRERARWENIWVCSNCGYTDKIEKEVKCWKCGKGEMLYQQHKAAVYLDSLKEG